LNDNHDVAHHILPIANRLVVFQSDLPHEVLPANKIRRSIAGWLRRDERL
jgi:SM-20-related protein